jgi:hypothetical protein
VRFATGPISPSTCPDLDLRGAERRFASEGGSCLQARTVLPSLMLLFHRGAEQAETVCPGRTLFFSEAATVAR